MLLDGGDFFLKAPRRLQEQGLLFGVVLVADDVAGVAGGNLQHLVLHVGHQFAVLDAAGRDFEGVLVADVEVFALLGNAPAVEIGDLLVGVEWNVDNSILASAGAEDFVGGADVFLHLSVETMVTVSSE